MSQAVLQTHSAEAQFATSSRSKEKRTISLASSSPQPNYLPGLRPVCNDLDAYFKDQFVWLSC